MNELVCMHIYEYKHTLNWEKNFWTMLAIYLYSCERKQKTHAIKYHSCCLYCSFEVQSIRSREFGSCEPHFQEIGRRWRSTALLSGRGWPDLKEGMLGSPSSLGTQYAGLQTFMEPSRKNFEKGALWPYSKFKLICDYSSAFLYSFCMESLVFCSTACVLSSSLCVSWANLFSKEVLYKQLSSLLLLIDHLQSLFQRSFYFIEFFYG